MLLRDFRPWAFGILIGKPRDGSRWGLCRAKIPYPGAFLDMVKDVSECVQLVPAILDRGDLACTAQSLPIQP